MVLSTFLLVLAAGCKRIPLYERSTKINLVVDLKRGLDHDIVLEYETELPKEYQDKIDGVVPTYYETLVYDPLTNALKSSHIVGEKGGSLSLFPGEYNLVLYNFGTESTQVKDLHHRLEANAFTTDITDLKSAAIRSKTMNEATKGSKAYENDPIIYEPDHLYVANKENVVIEAFQGREQEITIHTTASSILQVYSIEVLNVSGTENISKVEAFVTGQVLEHNFGVPQCGDSPATICIDLTVDEKNNRLYVILCTFGKLKGAENMLFLDVADMGTAGGKYRYIFDVTDQFDDPNNVNHRIVVDGSVIDIPKPELGGGGLKPSVDEWEKEEIDVPLG